MTKKILVVSANSFIAGHLQNLLRKLGFPVVVAADCQQAGESIVQPDTAFTLLSTQLPGVLPEQAVAYFRSIAPQVRVILLLAEDELPNAQALWSTSRSDGYVLQTSTETEMKNWLAANAMGLFGQAWQPPDTNVLPDIEDNIDPARVQQLIGELPSEDFNVVASACNELGKARSVESVPALIERLYEAPDELKIYVIWALGEIRDKRAVDSLVGLLNYIDPQVREGVIDALSKIKDPRTVRPLGRMLKVPDKKLRIMAIKALGLLGSREAIEVLEPMLKETDMEVRANAQWAIRKIDGVDR